MRELRNETQNLRERACSDSSSIGNASNQPPMAPVTTSSLATPPISRITFANNISSWPPAATVATEGNMSPTNAQRLPLPPSTPAALVQRETAQVSTSAAMPSATEAQWRAQSGLDGLSASGSYASSAPHFLLQQPQVSAHALPQASLHATANAMNQPVFMSQQPHGYMRVQPTPPAPYNIESGVLHRTKLYPLPEFDGNPEDWPLFYSSFADTTREYNYSDRQNLMRLQKALKGDAKLAVTSLLIFPENVRNILEELRFNFGRPELLIRAQLRKVQSFPNITEDRMEQVLDLSNQVRNITAFFKSARCEQHLVNPTLLEQLISKLPASKQFEWSKHASTVTPFATVETFAEWVGNLAKIIAIMPKVADKATHSTSFRAPRRSDQRPVIASRFLHSSQGNINQQWMCIACNQPHSLEDCPQFKTRNIENRWALVKRQRLCFACLQGGHNLQICQKKKRCNIQECQRVHHRLLHAPSNTHTVTSATTNNAEVVLSCQEEDVANQLGLNGQSSSLTLQWYGENTATEKSRIVSLEVQGNQGGAPFPFKNVRTVKSLNLPSQSFQNYRHFGNLPVASYNNVKPTLLLGLDNSFLGIATETVTKGPSQLIAAKTKLGWLAYGPTDKMDSTSPRVLMIRDPPLSKNICNMVEEYFTLENLGVKAAVTEGEDDMRAKAILKSTAIKIGDRYEIGLLWKQDDIVFPPSYDMAKRRLLSIENKMKRRTVFAESYTKGMARYIEKGYARELSAAEVNNKEPS
ncbi:uncharacterized protein [Eurosta solidaginis]|uniref:uncharacterized protein n=1 Tax=Eurosta solidaginis TaxID=178769 RepID=UPI0035309D39